MRRLWMALFLASCARAQSEERMEIVWLVGGAHSSSSTISGTDAVLSGTAGAATQVNYGYRLASTSLWLELPTTFFFEATGTVSGTTVASINRSSWFTTPGVQWKTPALHRFSFYGGVGGGFGTLSKTNSLVSGANGTVEVESSVGIHPTFDFAGGADLRCSRRFSLRAEGRNFVTAKNLGGVSGLNHPVFLAGLAVHF